MNVVDFGRSLIRSGDLDPIYLMLNAGVQDRALRARFCLAYWMFYHAGVSCRIAEAGSSGFWEAVWRAQDEKWPRGTERRHFKGLQSERAITELENKYAFAESAVVDLVEPTWTWAEFQRASEAGDLRTRPFAEVAGRAQNWRGFGKWISFKVADVLDAVLGVPVDFGTDPGILFDDPLKGGVWVAAQLAEPKNADDVEWLKAMWEHSGPDFRLQKATEALAYLDRKLWDEHPPHAPQRRLRLQELETILCKYKSHLNGRYEVGKDTTEIIHGLLHTESELAQHLAKTLGKIAFVDGKVFV